MSLKRNAEEQLGANIPPGLRGGHDGFTQGDGTSNSTGSVDNGNDGGARFNGSDGGNDGVAPLPDESGNKNGGTKTNSSESGSTTGKPSTSGCEDDPPPHKPSSPPIAKGDNEHDNNSDASLTHTTPDWVRR
eukprot:9314592-Ditylum_brightwellii.AAC.1